MKHNDNSVHIPQDTEADQKEQRQSSVLSVLLILLTMIMFLLETAFIMKECFNGNAFGFSKPLSDMKYMSFGMLMIFAGLVCNRYIIDKNSTTAKKIITWACSLVFVLTVIILLNNIYKYVPFCVLFDWPSDVTYKQFLINDITYHTGLGTLRYPALAFIYSAVFFICYHIFAGTPEKLIERLFCNKNDSEKQ